MLHDQVYGVLVEALSAIFAFGPTADSMLSGLSDTKASALSIPEKAICQ